MKKQIISLLFLLILPILAFGFEIDTQNAISNLTVPSGNVGIGTTEPLKPLHVLSTSAGATTNPLILTNQSSNASTAVGIHFNPSALSIVDNYLGNILVTKLNATTDYTARMDFSVTDSTGTNRTPLSILANTTGGNVGIGITSPQSKLDVVNTIRITDFYTDASNYESYTLDAGVTTADTLTIKGNTAGTGADNLNIALTPTGTGAVKVGKTVMNSSAVTCAANVCTDVPASPFIIITTDATAGADVLTIADGITGEIRTITLKTDGTTDLAITPTNFANGTIITLDTAGESAMIQFDGAKWFVIATYGGVVS